MPRTIQVDTTDYKNLLLEDYKKAVMEHFPVAAGQSFQRGHALALVNNQLVLCDGSKSDGSQVIFAIAAQEITTGEEPSSTVVYTEGAFDPRYILWSNPADNAENITHKVNARKMGIYFKAVI